MIVLLLIAIVTTVYAMFIGYPSDSVSIVLVGIAMAFFIKEALNVWREENREH